MRPALLRALALSSALSALLSASPARAQEARGFALNRFDPAERGSEWFSADSLDLRGHNRWAVGVVGDYSYRSLVLYRPDGAVSRSIVRNNLVLNPGASLVLWERLRIGLNVPVVTYVDGRSGALGGVAYPAPSSHQALGDVRLGGDVRLVGQYGTPFVLAAGAQVYFPTGSKGAYASDGYFRVAPRVAVAGDVGRLAYAARVSTQIRPRSEEFAGSPIGTELVFSAAAGYRTANRRLVIGPEVYGSTVLTKGGEIFATRTTPLEGVLGAHYTFAETWRVGAGVGSGITRGYGAPVARALAVLEWAPQPAEEKARPSDRDQDGIEDAADVCPDQAGASSDDARVHGCPDSDGDAIRDPLDACPKQRGVRSRDPKKHGCPADADGDGIEDSADACPNEPGVRTTDPKTHGCPADSDGDGIVDAADACPDVAGIKSDDPQKNGCPDPDRDQDGVLNDADACPDEKGAPDADPKKNGCPKAVVRGGQIVIFSQVKFKTASAQIVPGKDSEEVLEALADVLRGHPEITHVRVEGHTDDRGSAANNRKLSKARAQSVAAWLAQHGIDAARLTAEGFGPDKPIADNKTEDGRRQNRRVEFHIERDGDGDAAKPGAP